MQKFVRWRLRWEIFAITILAGSAPLALYAWYPLNFFNHSLQEIQDDVLRTELRDAEALYRVTLKRLEEDTRRLSRRIEENLQPSAQVDKDSFFIPQGIDFAYLIEKGASRLPFGSEVLKPPRQSVLKDLNEVGRNLACGSSLSGLVSYGSETFLLSTTTVRTTAGKEASDCAQLILGIDVNQTLVPSLSEMTQNTISLTLAQVKDRIENSAGIRVIKKDPSILTAEKELRGVDENAVFHLQVDLNTGLFSRLDSQQFWIFILFAGALYVGAFLTTTWVAAWILKPINRLVRIMGKIKGPDTYSKRLPEDRTDEIGRLAAGFNHLMARLEKAQKEIEAAEAQKIEAERLETIHAMVVTLAHEINNPLTYMLGEADLMLMEDLSDEDRRRAELIRDMSLRISSVIRKLQDLQKAELVTYLDWHKMFKIGETEEETRSNLTASADLVTH